MADLAAPSWQNAIFEYPKCQQGQPKTLLHKKCSFLVNKWVLHSIFLRKVCCHPLLQHISHKAEGCQASHKGNLHSGPKLEHCCWHLVLAIRQQWELLLGSKNKIKIRRRPQLKNLIDLLRYMTPLNGFGVVLDSETNFTIFPSQHSANKFYNENISTLINNFILQTVIHVFVTLVFTKAR